jgi:hypothetical protein
MVKSIERSAVRYQVAVAYCRLLGNGGPIYLLNAGPPI